MFTGDCDTIADSIPRVNDTGPGQKLSDLKIEVLLLQDYPSYNYVRITWKSLNYLGKALSVELLLFLLYHLQSYEPY